MKNCLKRWLCVLALVSSPTPAAVVWQYYPGMQYPASWGMVVGDFDGDGTVELAITGTSSGEQRQGQQLIGIVGKLADGRIGMRAQTMQEAWPDVFINRIVLVHDGHSPDRLVTLVPRNVDLTNGTYDRYLVEFGGGIPLRALRTMPVPMLDNIHAVADVDADGRLEIVGEIQMTDWAESRLTILDFDTGTVKWLGPALPYNVAVSQLDDDPALELVIAGIPGQIIDGKTHAVEWTYAPGFGYRVIAGRFGPDPGIPGFVAVVTSQYTVGVFRRKPYALINQFSIRSMAPTASAVLALYPGEGDSLAISAGNNSNGYSGPVVYDPMSGRETDEFSYYGGVDAIAGGDFRDIGRSDIVSIYGALFSDPAFFIDDVVTHDLVFGQLPDEGPFSSLAYCPGIEESSVSYVPSRYAYLSAGFVSLDAVTGLHRKNESGLKYTAIAAGRGEGGQRVLFGGQTYGVSARDCGDLTPRWESNIAGSRHITELSALDVNGDGIDDVFAIGWRGYSLSQSIGDVSVIDGRDGRVIWTSEGVAASRHLPFMMATLPVSQGRTKVAFAQEDQLRLFEVGATTVRQATHPKTIQALTGWGQGADCRLGIVDTDATLTIRRCDTFDVVAQYPLPAGTRFIRPMASDGTRFVVAADDRLHEVVVGGRTRMISEPMGQLLGMNNRGILIPGEEPGQFDLLIGSSTRIARLHFDARTDPSLPDACASAPQRCLPPPSTEYRPRTWPER